MTAKIIAFSADDTTYYTVPGSTGDFSIETATANDSIFGIDFQSTQSTLGAWTASCNAFLKNYAGYVATFKKSGTATSMTAQAMTLVTGKTYKVSDATKNALSYSHAVTVYDDAVDVTDEVDSIDYLFGRVTFDSGYTVTGDVTIDAYYLPLSAVGTTREFSLDMSAEAVDSSSHTAAQSNSGWRTYESGLKTVSLTASGFYNSSNAYQALVTGRSTILVEINPDGAGLSTARGYFKAISTGRSGDNGGNENEDISFELAVPYDTDVTVPFKWLHESASTMSSAVQLALSSLLNGTDMYCKNLPNGVAGDKGATVVTSVSLSNSVDGINEFSVSMQGNGAPSTVS